MPKSTDRNARASSDALISIALIEDNRVVRERLAELLGEDSVFRVVHTAAFSEVAAIQRAGADVLLLDIGLENGDSLEMARNMARELPGCRIIVMDLLPSHEDIRSYVEAGVAGFILKDASVEQLKETIRAVAGGAEILPTSVTHALFSQIANHAIKRGPQADDGIRLTSREREVLDLIAEGLSNKAIASRLHISTHTVKSHVRNIMEKLTLHTRLQLAAWAHHAGEGEAWAPRAPLGGLSPSRHPFPRHALAEVAAREALSPLERLEIMLHPWVRFVVLPLFAIANAGFALSSGDLRSTLLWAVFVGFTVGKPLGVVAFNWLAVRSGIAIRPPDLGWRLLVGGGMLAGIGFTMPVFIADLALATDLIGTAKLSVLLASTTSAVVGLSLLVSLTPKA